MKYLVLTIRKAEFDTEMVPTHYKFLEELRAKDLLEQAGPFTDSSGGAYILLADSLGDACAVAEKDPLHLAGCSTITVHEWNAK